MMPTKEELEKIIADLQLNKRLYKFEKKITKDFDEKLKKLTQNQPERKKITLKQLGVIVGTGIFIFCLVFKTNSKEDVEQNVLFLKLLKELIK